MERSRSSLSKCLPPPQGRQRTPRQEAVDCVEPKVVSDVTPQRAAKIFCSAAQLIARDSVHALSPPQAATEPAARRPNRSQADGLFDPVPISAPSKSAS